MVPPTLSAKPLAFLPPGMLLPREPVAARLQTALCVSLNKKGNAAAVLFSVTP
jgi:hypothetical protein